MASRGRFRGLRSWLQFRDESVVSLASILLPNSQDFRHDRATIGPRSGHDRGPGHSPIAVRLSGGDSNT